MFCDYGVKASPLRLRFEGRGSHGRIKDHRNAGKERVNFASGANAVAQRHQHIENHQIGLQFGRFFNGGLAVRASPQTSQSSLALRSSSAAAARRWS